jgi:hypothetical protein
MKAIRYIFLLILSFFTACGDNVSYPDTPLITYQNYSIYLTTDDLGNNIALIKLNIEFTDGDGDVGLKENSLPNAPDSLKYNLFLTLYDYKEGEFKEVEEVGTLNYRVPYIERTGQNKAIKGNIYIDIEFQSILYDTIFYSFYLLDRRFHKSNVDSTDVIVLSGIDL